MQRFALLVVACSLLPSLSAQTLVFWNSLDDDAAITHSLVGPPLAFYQGGYNSPEVVPPSAYVPGLTGNAFTQGPAAYNAVTRDRTIYLPNPGALLNPERGSIDVWHLHRLDAVPYAQDAYRLFDGPYGLDTTLNLHITCPGAFGPPRLYFGIQLGGTDVQALSLSDGLPGWDARHTANRWMHVAACWDRNGIAGTAQTVRLYVDGTLVAAASGTSWGTTFGPMADIGGGNGWLDHVCFTDELRIWNAAKTDWNDPVQLYTAQLDGPGSLFLGTSCARPGSLVFTAVSLDPWNAVAFGTGWLAGLHIGFFDVLQQYQTAQPPFVTTSDASGATLYHLPSGTLSMFAGCTLYAVTHELDPLNGAVWSVSTVERLQLH